MLELSEILRAQHVERWSLIATTRKQTVAEHTFNVTMIVRRMCKLAGVPDELAIKAALEHDLDEVITGDIPSPTKRRMEQMGFDFKELEGNSKNRSQLDYMLESFLKSADMIDAIHFLQNFGTGRRATEIECLLRQQLESVIMAVANSELEPTAAYISEVADDVLEGEA